MNVHNTTSQAETCWPGGEPANLKIAYALSSVHCLHQGKSTLLGMFHRKPWIDQWRPSVLSLELWSGCHTSRPEPLPDAKTSSSRLAGSGRHGFFFPVFFPPLFFSFRHFLFFILHRVLLWLCRESSRSCLSRSKGSSPSSRRSTSSSCRRANCSARYQSSKLCSRQHLFGYCCGPSLTP